MPLNKSSNQKAGSRPANSVQQMKFNTCMPPKGSNASGPKPRTARNGRPPVCYYSEQGPRDYMEDTYQIMHFNIGNKKGTFYGVFDGHGGKDVSFQLVNTKGGLFPFLIEAMKKYKTQPVQKVIRAAFLEYDRILFGKKLKSGSTAAVVLYYDDKIYMINLGDSRSLVFFENSRVFKITSDHKPWLSSERNRIFRAGYYVNPFKIYNAKNKKKYDNGDIYIDNAGKKPSMYLNGTWEPITLDQYQRIETLNKDVDTHRVCNSLALSRAFGDFYLKTNKSGTYMGAEAAISPEPDITIINLKPYKGKKAYIFLASDGFWDVTKVTQQFRDLLKNHPSPQQMCKLLVKDALDKGSTDNTSVVFDKFKV